MRSKDGKILGVGTNDLDYELLRPEKDAEGKTIGNWGDTCYHVWKGILGRLHSNRRSVKRNYSDCTLYEDWYFLSNFYSWFYTHWVKGWQLDKDLLVKGNREYGPETCRFVPGYLNSLFTDCANARGKWPLGVHRAKNSKRFQSRCCDALLGRLHLGMFDTPEEAHRAWQLEKINQINKAIDRFRKEPVGYRKDVEEALQVRICFLNGDINNERETFKL